MARKPDTPCSKCGKLTWSSDTSAPSDLRICQPCRRARGSKSNGSVLTATCVSCDQPFSYVKTGGNAPRACSRACRAILQRQANARPRAARPCEDCETPVVKFGKALCDGCAEERLRAYHQAKNRRRRAVKRQADAEPYTTAEIAERDRFRCQLCRRKVNMQLRSPHPRSPTIDHVIPIVEGGGDVRANVQLAHRDCNTRKGARGSQQLALVG